MISNLYFFILGRWPTLSSAEIWRQTDRQANFYKFSDEVLVLKTKEKLEVENLQKKLGGTIKIGLIFFRGDFDWLKFNLDIFLKELPLENQKRVYFGFSLYQLGRKINLKNYQAKIKKLALTLKSRLKEKNISSRWVESKEKNLSSVIIQKNRLLTQGREFVFLIDRNEILIGKTLSCQSFEEYERSDFGRPQRKIEEGMMPPKLAKIMINLAQVSENGVILDPFCGSGTILQEAILMGYQNVIGTDISEEAIKRTQENIRWLLESSKFEIQNSKLQFIKIKKCDVRNLSQVLSPNSVEAIVTEPYLGPLKISNAVQISNLINELSQLYCTAFREFKKILKKDGRIVIIFPIFKINSRLNFLPILDELKKSDWQIINPLPKELRKKPIIQLTCRGSIIYCRPDQKILREIFIFQLK
ncbi:MAG: DNA methyltransferase [Patescibacteria group bacterium]|nr:DNA methyltransferase [Patescibacteria group bacterium]